MHALLGTTCPNCGQIELPVSDVTLRAAADMTAGECVFDCPECSLRFTKVACEAMSVMLMAAGIDVSVWHDDTWDSAHLGPLTPREIDNFVSELNEMDAPPATASSNPDLFGRD